MTSTATRTPIAALPSASVMPTSPTATRTSSAAPSETSAAPTQPGTPWTASSRPESHVLWTPAPRSSSQLWVPSAPSLIVPERSIAVPGREFEGGISSSAVAADAKRGYEQLIASRGREYADIVYRDAWPVLDQIARDERHERVLRDFNPALVERP